MDQELIYSIKLEYKEHSTHPSQLFYAMGDLIESMKKLDDALIDSLPYQISNKIILESVETGSIITKLRTALDNIDDEALKELSIKKFIGSFLVKGKHKAIKLLAEKDGIADSKDFERIASSIEEVTEDELTEFGLTPNISRTKLLQAFNTISESMKQLGEEEKAIYISSEGSALINKNFSLSQDKIDELLTEKVAMSTIREIVDIKKPDYIGNSKWEVYFPQIKKYQFVKIEDKKWLGRFQSGDVDLRPGDSIDATIQSKSHIDRNSREILVEHSAQMIHRVIRNRDIKDNQASIFQD